MSDGRESNGGLLGLLGAGMVVCCDLTEPVRPASTSNDVDRTR